MTKLWSQLLTIFIFSLLILRAGNTNELTQQKASFSRQNRQYHSQKENISKTLKDLHDEAEGYYEKGSVSSLENVDQATHLAGYFTVINKLITFNVSDSISEKKWLENCIAAMKHLKRATEGVRPAFLSTIPEYYIKNDKNNNNIAILRRRLDEEITHQIYVRLEELFLQNIVEPNSLNIDDASVETFLEKNKTAYELLETGHQDKLCDKLRNTFLNEMGLFF
ncbi:hypothetical protein [Candidatus Paracaedibacter symbiosus]|uniref:hypothetical protein n=1 Tax=Candidatus Paracaedibacter symbiosus TaxID=244582 RepID=UPI000509576B|nr:hypothetical protein [Candidatus Paracaedibacter symbiosus]